MTDIHLASDGQTTQQKPLVALYWDFQNVKLKSSKLLNFANNLLNFASTKGRLEHKKVYYNSQHTDQAYAKNNLDNLCFNWRNVLCNSKNSADNQLIADCIQQVAFKPSTGIIILVLGDWDYAGLICILRSLGKKVIVIAQRGSESKKLIKIADEFYFVDELPQLVVDKTEPPMTFVQYQLNYEDAIECLIQAIKAASTEGKRADFSAIGKLMRRNPSFPTCKNFPSVCKPDGTKYPRFSKFIDAVVKDGKIRTQNQELFLIEKYKSAT
jgi:hypothetical protein